MTDNALVPMDYFSSDEWLVTSWRHTMAYALDPATFAVSMVNMHTRETVTLSFEETLYGWQDYAHAMILSGAEMVQALAAVREQWRKHT